MEHPFLFRALRQVEIEEKYKLIPKSLEEFMADPMFGIDMTFPLEFGSLRNAVRQHQWKQNGFPTRGVSTTPKLERAMFYATENKVIAKIDTSKFIPLGIKVYDVNELLKERPNEIACFEDNEFILVYNKAGAFPREIINEIIHT